MLAKGLTEAKNYRFPSIELKLFFCSLSQWIGITFFGGDNSYRLMRAMQVLLLGAVTWVQPLS